MQYAEFYEYITTEGERWDTIAYKFYGDAAQYEPIVVSNPYVPLTPILPAGIKLQIPVIASTNELNVEGLPPWTL